MTPGRRATLEVGLVGLGWIGRRHLDALQRSPGVTVRGVADVDAGRRAEAAASGPTAYAEWADLLEQERLDALFVATPPRAHAAPAIAALERGLPVFVEKPLARDLSDGRAIVGAARTAGTFGALGYQWRAIDFLDDLRAGLADERIGLLCGRSLGPSSPRPWFVSWEAGGGVLLELASHDIDLQRAVAGEIVAVQAAAGEVPIVAGATDGVRSVLSLTLHFASGALGAVQVAWLAGELPTDWALDVVSDRSALYVELDPTFRVRGRANGRDVDRVAATPPSAANIARFLEAVRRDDPGLVACSLDEGLGTLEAALACDVALQSGATVAVGAGRPVA